VYVIPKKEAELWQQHLKELAATLIYGTSLSLQLCGDFRSATFPILQRRGVEKRNDGTGVVKGGDPSAASFNC